MKNSRLFVFTAIPAAFMAAAGSAMAAVPEEVNTSLATLKLDATTMAVTVLVAIIAVFAIKFLRKGI